MLPAVFSWRRSSGALLTGALFVVTGCPKTATVETTEPPSPRPEATSRPTNTDSDAPAGPATVFRGGTVMTATGVVYPKGEVLVVGDRITAVGAAVQTPDDVTVVDISGKVLTPGIIDTHSHIGVYASPGFSAHADGNEATNPITAEVWAADSVWPQDPQLQRARAGGVTAMQILPGSANLIGGKSVVIKPYPGIRTAQDARVKDAPIGLKMACGENPKRVYGEKGGPSTRMGNVARYRAAFSRAAEYRRGWQRYHDRKAHWEAKQHSGTQSQGDGKDGDGSPPDPPAVDAAMETLAAVLAGDILVHMHCYRADEMSLMLDLANDHGFEIRSFHHAVEAYKIADVLAEQGVAASIWADWWGFKAEAYDGIRENAAMLFAAGARPIIHSDSATGIQRLNQETAKAASAGRRMGVEISDDEALRWITANPAWALGIDGQVGTLEPGKLADLVVWSGDPFSVYTKAERVYIEGQLVHDIGWGERGPRSDFEVGLMPGDLDRQSAPAVHPPAPRASATAGGSR